jgi:predicted lipoprotein with Yx(FWY)xxD motif
MIRVQKFALLLLAPSLLFAAGCAERMGSPETPETAMRPAAGRAQMTIPLAPETTEPAAPSVGVASVGVSSVGSLGRHLVDSSGRALYLFMADEGTTGSTCYGACAQAWPPVISSGLPSALDVELDRTKLGTIPRNDGTLQVTYAGWPLYYYARDRSSGDTLGQDLMDFGAKWYLVSPAGERLEGQPMQAPSTTEPPIDVPPVGEPETIDPPTRSPSPGGIY